MSGMLIKMEISIFTAITEKGTKSFPKRSLHLINRKDLTMNAADFFKILTNLKIFGEYHDGNTHYWTDRKFDDDGNAYTLIIADIPNVEKKYTEQITYKVKEL